MSESNNSPAPGGVNPSRMANYFDLFQRMRDPIFLLSYPDLLILEVNASCENVFKIPLEGFLGRSILEWIQEKQREEFEKNLRVTGRRYHPRELEVEFTVTSENGKGQRVLFAETVLCSLLLSDATQVIQVIVKDVSSQRELEQKAKRYQEELEESNQRLELLSITDGMTKVYNYRYFISLIEKEHIRSQRFGSPYSLLFMDVDHFKHYNDHWGHPAGDLLLCELTGLLKAVCRKIDVVARYGGEEFVVLCPETDQKGVVILAERLRTTIEGHSFPHGSSQPLGKVSVSIGISCFPQNGSTFKEIIEKADQAVYRSKSGGRNRWSIAQ